MFIVTFYSYRGGVGRTTALVNVGFELARRGRKVLLVDFDLEAPDLNHFLPLKSPEPHLGMVEYVAAYREKGHPPDVMEYLYRIETVGKKGDLWVMPAGRNDPEYQEALADIDWQGFYDRQDGYLFFEDLRSQWEQKKFDYVLIDTHSGISPSLGISTRQLADAVMMMFNPHQGPRIGLNQVSFLIENEAEKTGRKPIEQLFVATPVVEADESPGELGNETTKEGPTPQEIKETMARLSSGPKVEKADEEEGKLIKLDWAWGSFGGGEYENHAGIFEFESVPFSNQLLLGKRVVVDQDSGPGKQPFSRQDSNRLKQAYRRLTNVLIKNNFAQDRDGAKAVLCEIHADPRSASGIGRIYQYKANFKELEQIIGTFGREAKDAEIQAQAACCFFAVDLYDSALQCLDLAIELQPNSPELLWQRASYRSTLGMKKRAVEDLLRLLKLGTPKPPSVGSPLESLKKHIKQGGFAPKRPRFALPEEFQDLLAWPIGLPDYSFPLLRFGGVDPYVVSALQKLRELDDGSYQEAKKNPFLVRIELERDQQADPQSLAKSYQWAALVDMLQHRIEESEWRILRDCIFLFLAWLGLGNEQEVQTWGKRATERFNQLATQQPSPEELGFSELQILAFIFWKTGDGDYGRQILDVIGQNLMGSEEDWIFSFWRCDQVFNKVFMEDCHLIRQLFNGANISPPFLGKKPAQR